MTFGEALEAMKAGRSVTRAGWTGPETWLRLLASPHGGSDANLPYIVVFREKALCQPDIVPWVAPHADMLAADWSLMIGDD